jgi:uncharacterized membrane protein
MHQTGPVASLDATQPPRLVGDTYRSMIAVAVMMGISLVAGVGYGFAAATYDLPVAGRTYWAAVLLIVYLVYFVVYQVMTHVVMQRANGAQLAEWARQTTPRTRQQRWMQLLTFSGARSWAVSAALLALASVLAIALFADLRNNVVILVSSLLVVGSGWTMIAYAFAVAYLRQNVEHGGLQFPTDAAPVWSDYLYLAVQVSTTFSGSDVTVSNTAMRRLLTAQALIAFLFNTVIVALLVSALLSVPG